MTRAKNPPRSPCQDDPVVPLPERRSLQTLLLNECRWPVGDPQLQDFHFCGKEKETVARPYCEFHMRRGFQVDRRQYRPWIPPE